MNSGNLTYAIGDLNEIYLTVNMSKNNLTHLTWLQSITHDASIHGRQFLSIALWMILQRYFVALVVILNPHLETGDAQSTSSRIQTNPCGKARVCGSFTFKIINL